MQSAYIALIFFIYGLAFFSMGFAITLEVGRGTDERLQHALWPLAGFGLIHGIHEWIEMFQALDILPGWDIEPLGWESVRVALLAFSFLSLAAFGSSLLSPDARRRRLSLLVPVLLASIWGFGIFVIRGRYSPAPELWNVADVWTRYALAIPSALLACAGLIAQQRVFRKAGMARFGRDSLWAAVAFAWYGVVGQTFTRASMLPPSHVINQDLFLQIFGFPVQLLRAGAAGAAALFVMRFLRSFEVETKRQIAELQAAQLGEAKRREKIRGKQLKRVVAAQEAERQRISRELHDETGQALTAIGLGLRAVATTINQDEEKAVRNLRQLEKLVALSIDELQRIISDLRPSHLDDLGLAAALRWYAGEVQERASLDVLVEVEGESHPLPSAAKTGLFRIAQEAMTNIVKHADATNVRVGLYYDEESIKLEVEDDGCGFDSKVLSLDIKRPSWGLEGMEERATELGGWFRLYSQPGKGTRVEVVVPYQDESGS